MEPWLLCFGGFVGIWLIFDMSGSGGDMVRSGASLKQIGLFYLFQLPQILLISLPVAILLALLFCCSRMSRANEIISMLSAGRSLPRILLPLFTFGTIVSIACIFLNLEWGPKAEATRKAMLEEVRNPAAPKKSAQLQGYLFKDRISDRTWFVKKLSASNPVLEGVLIIQQDQAGNIVRKWYAARAIHDPISGRWTLQRGMIVDVDTEGEIVKVDNFEEQGQRTLDGWHESPKRIVAASLDPQQLSVAELDDFIEDNADFPEAQLAQYKTILHDRWALPWSCLAVVFIAAPLGVVYSRRGAVSGIGLSILLFFLMMVSRNLFLALGKGARMAPEIAGWAPVTIFSAIGLLLLWMKANNRDFASLFSSRR